uniref:Peptidase S1 domain-containing protein n=1 Tax=Gopherus evgoodei TaxID=1825980 RepID=A0A8C4YP64_9SAUR
LPEAWNRELQPMGAAGVMPAGGSSRIIGGQSCGRHQQTYQVALMDSPNTVRCGGVLIDPSWVLTAAHCDTKRPISIRLGEYSLKASEGTEQCIKSTQSFPHPNYNLTSHDYDIMLLKLQNTANLNNYVKTIGLPDRCPEPNTECLVSGWVLGTPLQWPFRPIWSSSDILRQPCTG